MQKTNFKKLMMTMALFAICSTASAQTASDHYLDINNFETIGAPDLTKIDNIFQYNKSSASEAWLTLSVYGAAYGGGTKNWLEVSNGSSVKLSSISRTWNSASPFLGSSGYFTSTPPRAFGYSTSQNTNERIITFYVTNITGVELLGTNYNNDHNTVTQMTIYECTKNANGTLTASTTSVFNTSNTSKKDNFTFKALSLSSDKFYKVVCSTICGYFYEIAFRTPLQYIDAKITSAGISTFYCDFPVTIPYTDDGLMDVKYIKGVTNNSALLVRLSTDVPANTGVILEGNPGTYRFYRNTGAVTPLNFENLLSGSTESISCDEAIARAGKTGTKAFIMTLGAGGPNGYIGFYGYKGTTLAANKAYIVYDPDEYSNVSFLSLGGYGEDDTNGIRDIKSNKVDGAWYTLQGVRLSGEPAQSGIYIHGGKKVAVK